MTILLTLASSNILNIRSGKETIRANKQRAPQEEVKKKQKTLLGK